MTSLLDVRLFPFPHLLLCWKHYVCHFLHYGMGPVIPIPPRNMSTLAESDAIPRVLIGFTNACSNA